METIQNILELLLHFDRYLLDFVNNQQTWAYLILFLIIFCETGLIVMPFLPGDSLLFASGTLAALGVMNIWVLVLLLCVAAFLGDSVNFSIGSFLGKKVFERDYRFFKREHLIKTNEFYERHGGKTIILARFIPIVRTFAPFIAGVGKMDYSRFMLYNVIGGILWVFICSFGGYFFGNIPFVKDNFSVVILAISFISLLPMLIQYVNHQVCKYTKQTKASA